MSGLIHTSYVRFYVLGGVSRLLLFFVFQFGIGTGDGGPRGGKVGISRRLRDFQGSVGSGGNPLLVFTGFHAPVFSTASWFGRADELRSRPVKPPYDMRSEPDRHRLIQMLVDRDRATSQSVAKGSLVDLPRPVRDRHRVVLVHNPLGLHREDPVQVRPTRPPEIGRAHV